MTERGEVPTFARLLLPEGATWVPGGRWRLDDLPEDQRPVLWGEGVDASLPLMTALRRAAARERAIGVLRLRRRIGGVHRFGLETATTSSVRSRVRRWLKGGTIVELGTRCAVPPLTAVLEGANLEAVGAPRVSAGGGALQMARTPGGEMVVVRVGFADERSSPRRASEGLREVAGLDVPAPRLLATGRNGSMCWSVESRLPGRAPVRVFPPLLEQIATVLASLPRATSPVEATRADLEAIAEIYPRHVPQLSRLAGRVDLATQDIPPILGHRDVWPGNVLVDDGRLTGLVDWGSWHSQAAPGADLLQFCTAVLRRRRRQSLGAAWLTRPWLEPAIRSVLRLHLQRLDVEARPSYLEALGVAWWAAEVAGTLERFPQRARDEAWTSTNVDAVLVSIGP